MQPSRGFDDCQRVLVVVPNWVGDVVLATPALRAIRERFAAARITYLMRRYVSEVLAGAGWHDHEMYWSDRRGLAREWENRRLLARVRREGFDLALLLTNSFRSALLAWAARIPRRVGFARDGRGWMLTHRLYALRRDGRLVPSPVSRAYARIAETVGCTVGSLKPRLAVTPEQERAATDLKRHYGLDDGRPYAVINPGAAFGAAKCWPPERFAALCDAIGEHLEYRCVLVGAPREAALMRRIAHLARSKVVCCDDPGATLGSLKGIIRDAALLVCNDTGPRHYGNAFNVPTVTIFGPTHPAWTHTDYEREVRVQVAVECGPCQLRTCPLDHRCMMRITPEMVMDAVRRVVQVPAPTTAAAVGT